MISSRCHLAPCLALMVIAGAGVPLYAQEQKGYDDNEVALWLNRHSEKVVGAALTVLLIDDAKSVRLAGDCVDATMAALGAAEGLKAVTKQPRPRDSSARDGFPSAHATAAFAFAHCLADARASTATAAYSFAGAVGWARAEGGYHTPEQVLAGAALGLWVAEMSLDNNGFAIKSGADPKRAFVNIPGERAAERAAFCLPIVLWERDW